MPQPWEMNWDKPQDEESVTDTPAVQATVDVKPWDMDWSPGAAPAATVDPHSPLAKYTGQGAVTGTVEYARDYASGIGSSLNNLDVVGNKNPATAQGRGLLGAADAAASVASSALAPIAGAVDMGLSKLGFSDPKNPTNDYATARDKYVYQPRTDEGKALTGTLGAVAKPLGDLFQGAGNVSADVAKALGASDATVEDVREMAPDAAGYLLGGKVKGRYEPVKVAERARVGAAKADASAGKAATELFKMELEEAGGRNIDIRAKKNADEATQEYALGKWVSENEINKAKTPDEKLVKVRSILTKAGKEIGENDNALTALAKNKGLGPIKIKTEAVTSAIKKDPQYIDVTQFSDAATGSVKKVYEDALTEMGKSKGLSFDDLSRLKRVINDRIDWVGGDAAANTAAKKIWHLLDDSQEQILSNADKLASKTDKGMIAKLRKSKDNYAKASQIEEGLIKARNAKGQKHNLFTGHGFTHTVNAATTPLGKATALAGGLLGGAAGHAITPFLGTTAGGVGAALAGGKLGDALVKRNLKSKVRNSRFYTPP